MADFMHTLELTIHRRESADIANANIQRVSRSLNKYAGELFSVVRFFFAFLKVSFCTTVVRKSHFYSSQKQNES